MALHKIVCRVCSEPFEAVRSDAESCSHACRMRLYRSRTAARHARTKSALAGTRAVLGETLALAVTLVDDLESRNDD